ncbi:guanine deaminase [Halomonas janggokensis]|uniref:Guanine deaminase n=1 Tax=Vreelandella janggokensis TaxID=370767 RepID=A0ABT4IS32_9GAMM|nr:guanine deaminase [Halomonas janggokensis]MCZ0926270.1 guanine deaminase [Halomonas janggokensis]MCZ0928808.1 guanine deaminase [Halomonas janggokensis]
MNSTTDTLIRAELISFARDPGIGDTPEPGSLEHYGDGLLWLKGQHIHAVGHFNELLPSLPENSDVLDYRDKLIMPGFIDTHVHYVQLDIMASYGRQLLDWLNDYTFPEECRFANHEHAEALSNAFLDEMLRAGTTTSQVFGSSHQGSVDAFFTACQKRRLRMLAGKVLMDRNAPEALMDGTTGIAASERLIEDWHGKQRLGYSVTPRFAPTSTKTQMDAAGALLRNDPSLWLQTHLAENSGELDWVAELFPGSRDYLSVYEEAGLVGSRSTFAHGIHLDNGMRKRLAERGANIAFCPSSNLFLGSGLFDREAANETGMAFTYASDIGAGTDLSGFDTLKSAYQVGQLRGQPLTAWQGFYGLTKGNAKALSLDSHIGQLAPTLEADFVVIDTQATSLLKRRINHCKTLGERLFALMMLADDRAIYETWAGGICQHHRDN